MYVPKEIERSLECQYCRSGIEARNLCGVGRDLQQKWGSTFFYLVCSAKIRMERSLDFQYCRGGFERRQVVNLRGFRFDRQICSRNRLGSTFFYLVCFARVRMMILLLQLGLDRPSERIEDVGWFCCLVAECYELGVEWIRVVTEDRYEACWGS